MSLSLPAAVSSRQIRDAHTRTPSRHEARPLFPPSDRSGPHYSPPTPPTMGPTPAVPAPGAGGHLPIRHGVGASGIRLLISFIHHDGTTTTTATATATTTTHLGFLALSKALATGTKSGGGLVRYIIIYYSTTHLRRDGEREQAGRRERPEARRA